MYRSRALVCHLDGLFSKSAVLAEQDRHAAVITEIQSEKTTFFYQLYPSTALVCRVHNLL